MAELRFAERVAVITGAANGIGREYAHAFAREGASVVVADVDDVGVAATVASINAARAGAALGVHCDVSEEVDVDAMVTAACDVFGGIDTLVNNAGLHLGRFSETSTLPVADWRRILDVNVVGAMLCARACRASMIARGGGVIINQSSMAAYLSAGGAYGVSKLALNGLTMSLAAEFGPEGTRVVGVAPGMIGSPAVLAHLATEHKDLVTRGQMVKRFGEMSDLVGMVLFLASNDASFITGQTYTVDGGFVPRP